MRTQISSDDAARIYKSAGGAYDQGDSVGVCVPTYNPQAAAGAYNVSAAVAAAALTTVPGRNHVRQRSRRAV
jgi:hypothetical protein